MILISQFSDQDYEHEQESDRVGESYSSDDDEITYVPDNYSRMREAVTFYCRLMAFLVMLVSFLLMFDDLSNFKHFVRWLLIWFGTELVGFVFGFHWLRRVGRN